MGTVRNLFENDRNGVRGSIRRYISNLSLESQHLILNNVSVPEMQITSTMFKSKLNKISQEANSETVRCMTLGLDQERIIGQFVGLDIDLIIAGFRVSKKAAEREVIKKYHARIVYSLYSIFEELEERDMNRAPSFGQFWG